MRRIGEHAVVIGGSVAGLLAARALTEAYDRVTVIDRDALPDGVADRRAVPQGRHAHALLPLGQRCLEQLLPGAVDALVADGAASCAALEEYRFVVSGSRLAPVSTGNRTVFASRPFIEGHVRARVRALPGVALRDRCDVLGLLADGSRVTGVRILRRAPGSAEERLAADLVVAASGRAARVPAWLEQLGWERPDEERLAVDVGYASRFVRLPEGALGDERMLLITATPEWPRALYVFPQEGGRHIVSVGGYGAAHRPPADPAAFMAFVLLGRAARPAGCARRGRAARATSPPTRSRSASGAATSASRASPTGCWCAATRSPRSTRPTGRGCRWPPRRRSRCATAWPRASAGSRGGSSRRPRAGRAATRGTSPPARTSRCRRWPVRGRSGCASSTRTCAACARPPSPTTRWPAR